MPIISLSFGPYTSTSQLPSQTLPPLFPVLGKVKHSLFGLAQPFGSLSSTAAKGTPCFHNFSIGNDVFTPETDTARALCAPHSQQLPTTRLVCGNCLTGAARGTARQHCIGPSWASNDAPSKDLSNMRALQHLAPLATGSREPTVDEFCAGTCAYRPRLYGDPGPTKVLPGSFPHRDLFFC